MVAVITVQAVPAGSAIGGAVGGRCLDHRSRVGPGGEAVRGEGVIGDGILDCYEGLGLGLQYRHVVIIRVGGGGGLCCHC